MAFLLLLSLQAVLRGVSWLCAAPCLDLDQSHSAVRDQMMTNKFTFVQFSLAGFVPSSLILPAKGSVYFP